MPNSKSAAKRVRTSADQRERNKTIKSSVKTAIKGYDKVLREGDAEQSRAKLQKTSSVLDKAAAKGIMHKNAAARYKSRLARRLAKQG